MRSVEWDYKNHKLNLIDQRLLPVDFVVSAYSDHESLAQAITDMVVRGAPAIGATAAFGLALAANEFQGNDSEAFKQHLSKAGHTLIDARPTAVNLPWAVKRILDFVKQSDNSISELQEAVLSEAQKLADEDAAMNEKTAEIGAELIEDGDTIIHHCNTGSLATVDWGTALGVIRKAHEQGKNIHVLVDETRPRLQGARLTAWELIQFGIPFDIIPDSASGHFLRSGQAQKVFFGADRVAANGDVANKIGTYNLALAAHANQVPAYCVFPTSTLDMLTPNGDEIEIEERTPTEVLNIKLNDRKATPDGASARNPAFDITPHHLITGLITELGIISPPFGPNLKALMEKQKEH